MSETNYPEVHALVIKAIAQANELNETLDALRQSKVWVSVLPTLSRMDQSKLPGELTACCRVHLTMEFDPRPEGERW